MMPTSRAWARKSVRPWPISRSWKSAGEAQEITPRFLSDGRRHKSIPPPPAESHQVDLFAVYLGAAAQIIQPALQVARPAEDIKIPLAHSGSPEIEDHDEKPFPQSRSARAGYPGSSAPFVLPGIPWQMTTDGKGAGVLPEGTSRRKSSNLRSSRKNFPSHKMEGLSQTEEGFPRRTSTIRRMTSPAVP